MYTPLHMISKPWMMEERRFSLLTSHFASYEIAYQKEAILKTKAGPEKVYKEKGIALIPVQGVLTRRPDMLGAMLGFTSYEEIEERLRAALEDKHIHTVMLDIDSPGGETSGLFDLCDFIYHARSKKNIIALARDEAYSAAYAIASSAENLFVSRTSGAGSIGVIAYHADVSVADKKQGITYTPIQAGKRKTDLSPHAPLSPEAANSLQTEVNRLYEMFVNLVARNRTLSEEAVKATEAGLYFGENIITLGLADKMTASYEGPVHQETDKFCLDKLYLEKPHKRVSMTELSKINNEKNEELLKDKITLGGSSGHTKEAFSVDNEALLKKAIEETRLEYRAELTELIRICQMARKPEKLSEFIESNTTPEQAREELLKLLASDTEKTPIHSVLTSEHQEQNLLVRLAGSRVR